MDSTLSKSVAGAVDVLSDLASRLGTTVESLWPSFVRYTQMEAMGNLLGLVVLTIFLVVLTVVLPPIVYVATDTYSKESKQEAASFMKAFILGIGGPIVAIVWGVTLPTIFAAFMAPEAAAAMKILEMLK